jgi:hypothetical protein
MSTSSVDFISISSVDYSRPGGISPTPRQPPDETLPEYNALLSVRAALGSWPLATSPLASSPPPLLCANRLAPARCTLGRRHRPAAAQPRIPASNPPHTHGRL